MMISPVRIAETEAMIRKLLEFDLAQLSREAELGPSDNFSAAADIAQAIVDLYKPITLKVLSVLPISKHVQICEHAGRALSAFKDILDFVPRPSDTSYERSVLTTQLGTLHEEIFASNVGLFAFAKMASIGKQDILENVAGIEEKLAKALQAAEQHSKEVEELASYVKKLVAGAAAGISVSQNSDFFMAEANRCEKLSGYWMMNTVAAAAVAVSVAVAVFSLPDFVALNNNFASIASRFFAFSVMGYILYLCGKTYLSHRHNAVVNRHRQNALSTYSTLMQATSDKESSDIVLTHAAACIFSPQNSGYAKSADMPNAISFARSVKKISSSDGE